MDLTEFLNEFQLEAGEKLDAIASQLLRLERDATDPRPVREMFLAAHTIKGGAAMLRLTEVETIAHAVEDQLSAIRDGQRVLDHAAADLLFEAIDRLRALVACASSASVGAAADAALLALADRLRRGSTAQPAEKPRRRALVVDASATVRELHRLLLEGAGFSVEECADGQLALSRALTEQFELVVASVQCPGQGGMEIASALRSSSTRVLLASADASPNLAHEAALAGAAALVRKGGLQDADLARVLRDLG